jgi:hypothetical protein
MGKSKRNKIATLLLFVQIGIVHFLSKFPHEIENFYTNGIYIYISNFFRFIFGWLPFSVGDFLYLLLILLIIRFLYLFIKNKESNRISLIYQLFAAFSVFYFCFYFFWGLNYSRLPISNTLKFNTEKDSISSKNKYDIEKLKSLSDQLILKIIHIQSKLVSNDTLPVLVPHSKSEILQLTQIGYHNLSEQFEQFSYKPSSIKKSLFSLPLTYMGFAGYLNPITGEAQVDYLIPKISLPATCSHEVAHQLGIASESEANFVGYLAGNSHDDLFFQYSVNLMALRYILYDIYRFDPDLYKEYKNKLPKGILKNMQESQEFWSKYENPFEPIFKYFYDNYLKYNQQKDGLKSYNQMVGLLIAYNDKYGLK